MANNYSEVRRSWRSIDARADLESIWRGERFENTRAVEDALRVYELAIRVEGWGAVKAWAGPMLERGEILNAQLVELAMRSVEQRDEGFFETITVGLLQSSPPNYFRFWIALFQTRHSAYGEKLFRAQLAELSDYRVVKYRRQLRTILRKLRFRCHTDRERAIGAIAFGEYKKYDAKAYPSEVFSQLIECQKRAATPPRSKKDKPVTRTQHVAVFAEAAASLGIWSITEGIRTCAKLPRTLTYLSAMAPKMTDQELRRALRAFDGPLKTATHKKASERVVALAELMKTRLGAMDVSLEEWAKIFPYMESPTLREVLESLVDAGLARHAATIEAARTQAGTPTELAPVVVLPSTIEGRRFRAGLLAAYLLHRLHDMASLSLVDAPSVTTLCRPTKLYPYGYGAVPMVTRWQPEPDRPHRVLHQLMRETFPSAATRRANTSIGLDSCVRALRDHLRRRAVVDGALSDVDVPILVLTNEPITDEREALLAHLDMFPGAVLVLLETEWHKPIDRANVLCVNRAASVEALVGLVGEVAAALPSWQAEFAKAKPALDRELRKLQLGVPWPAAYVRSGPFLPGY